MPLIFTELNSALLVLAISIVFYYFILRPWNYFKRHGIAFDGGIPPFGSYYNYWFKGESWMDTLKRIYYEHPNARFVGMHEFGGKVAYLIRDPELITDITTKHFDHFVNRIMEYHDSIDPMYAHGLSNLKEEKWRKMRSTLTPLYTSCKFRTIMIPAMIAAKQALVDGLITQMNKNDEKKFDMMDISTRSTIDTFLRSALGIETDILDNEKNEFKVVADEFLNHMMSLNGIMDYVNGKIPRLSKLLLGTTATSQSGTQLFERLVKDVAAQRTSAGVERSDVLGLVINAKKQDTNLTKNNDKGICNYLHEQTQTHMDSYLFRSFVFCHFNFIISLDFYKNKHLFFLSGHSDTVIIAQCYEFFEASFTENNLIINYIVQTLANQTDIQRRVRDEMVQINRSLDNGIITNEALREMKYMNMVLSEALRVCPITSELRRRAVKPYKLTDYNGNSIVVQPGEAVWMPSFTLQNDPKYFSQPDLFNPERFSDINKDSIQTGTYAPFGMGPRDCIGCRFIAMEVKITFFYLLQYFDLIKCDSSTSDSNEIILRRRMACSI